ncbi:hypothetical protein ACIRBY_37140 [Streptomyces sp. NPDC096136]|uniref:hypothetical protein n=1 Tax=Streptomyces sp. NPDC096136 TaxID=3366076 RepID=UPI0037FCEDEA
MITMASPRIQFRAMSPLDEHLASRTRGFEEFPDDAVRERAMSETARMWLSMIFNLFPSELRGAALSEDEAVLLLQATQGMILDSFWGGAPNALLSAEVEEADVDDETGEPGEAATSLAQKIRTQWSRGKALAVVDACVRFHNRTAGPGETVLDGARAVGLLQDRGTI